MKFNGSLRPTSAWRGSGTSATRRISAGLRARVSAVSLSSRASVSGSDGALAGSQGYAHHSGADLPADGATGAVSHDGDVQSRRLKVKTYCGPAMSILPTVWSKSSSAER